MDRIGSCPCFLGSLFNSAGHGNYPGPSSPQYVNELPQIAPGDQPPKAGANIIRFFCLYNTWPIFFENVANASVDQPWEYLLSYLIYKVLD